MYNCINFFVMVVVFARQGWLCYIVVSLSYLLSCRILVLMNNYFKMFQFPNDCSLQVLK